MIEQDHGINFFSEDIDFQLEDEQKYKDWILKLATSHQTTPSVLNYIFCSDAHLLDINKTYLEHDYFTDIITFPIQKDPLEADIFISVERVRDNAQKLQLPEGEELLRVMAHGILHLVGFSDKEDNAKLLMEQNEDKAIALFHEMFPKNVIKK